MIIAVDIGNTNIVVGGIEADHVLFTERLSTRTDKTELEYAIDFKLIFELHSISHAQVEGSIISSVVPPLSNIIKTALTKLIPKEPLIVGPGVKTGLSIRIDNEKRQYIGGAIAPGAAVALNSLSSQTSQLPFSS